MLIIRSAAELENFIGRQKANAHSIGFVPTMGALHDGHLSLVKRAVDENDIAVVSVFVNPTQFNNPTDLATYPRDEEADIRLLAGAGVTAVFCPTVNEIYPGGVDSRKKKSFRLGTAAEVMEGKFRPGHFQGVAEVVARLFALVRPDRAYFGEKDFQQIAVIRNMVESEGIDVQIVACPIKRGDDGLALSSRNALLSPQQRAVAPEIHRALADSAEFAVTHSLQETRNMVIDRLNATEFLEVEYFEIVDGRTLMPVDNWAESPWIVGCITVYCGKVRLIDNICYKNHAQC
ncbi:MAG: pantoate--beta-alanine ligase [Candidatus Amulumruptor caecigallinarius]|nr:pantoate--beta-alanine ligase [Candidatus Amulumruptor caecigallinarius]